MQKRLNEETLDLDEDVVREKMEEREEREEEEDQTANPAIATEVEPVEERNIQEIDQKITV